MRIVVAPDKFKGTLDASAVAAAVAAGIRRAAPDADVVLVPLADGGEGTVDALVAAGATRLRATARDPLGREVEAGIAMRGDTAVVEGARVGLGCLGAGERDAGRASSAGVGDLIRAARDGGAREVLVGVGGSAWTDGGTGMATALGWRFLDAAGKPLPPGGAALTRLDRIEPGAPPGESVTALCDVDNPLVGARGAARTFAPQKGATPDDVAVLEAGLARLALLLPDGAHEPGAGAGGGLGYGIVSFLGGRLVPGFDVIADLADLDGALAGADLVITGEGRLDDTSFGGKTPVGVARRARAAGVECVAVAGEVTASPDALRRAGFARWVSLAEVVGPGGREDAAAALAEVAGTLLG